MHYYGFYYYEYGLVGESGIGGGEGWSPDSFDTFVYTCIYIYIDIYVHRERGTHLYMIITMVY